MIRMKNRVNNNLIDETNSNATMRFYMDAKIDNFARAHTDTWHTGQRYYVDESLWCGSGCPIFVMVGGESPQGPPSEAFFMHTLAKEHKALMVSVEHRFYGQSQPLESLEVANLNYLSSQQALADLARIITYIKSNDWSVVADKSSNPPLTLKADAAHSPVITQGASAEKNTWWVYLRQAFASRPTTHPWNFVNNECQTTPGGAPLPVQGAPAKKKRGARWAYLTGRPSSTSPETIRRRRTARPCAPSDTCGHWSRGGRPPSSRCAAPSPCRS